MILSLETLWSLHSTLVTVTTGHCATLHHTLVTDHRLSLSHCSLRHATTLLSHSSVSVSIEETVASLRSSGVRTLGTIPASRAATCIPASAQPQEYSDPIHIQDTLEKISPQHTGSAVTQPGSRTGRGVGRQRTPSDHQHTVRIDHKDRLRAGTGHCGPRPAARRAAAVRARERVYAAPAARAGRSLCALGRAVALVIV